jgi:hypothetical protein
MYCQGENIFCIYWAYIQYIRRDLGLSPRWHYERYILHKYISYTLKSRNPYRMIKTMYVSSYISSLYTRDPHVISLRYIPQDDDVEIYTGIHNFSFIIYNFDYILSQYQSHDSTYRCQDYSYQPKTHHDSLLRPSYSLEVMMKWRYTKYFFTVTEFFWPYLQYHRYRL